MNDMQDQVNNSSKITQYIEQIMFDKKRLNALKQSIKQVCANKVDDRSIREYILKERVHIFQKLSELIPYFLQNEIRSSLPNSSSKEIEEKDSLLEEIGQRINKIYQTLQEKNSDIQ